MTIRVSLNHNSMVSLQDDPITFSEGRNCIRKVATLNSLTYTQSARSQHYKDILHINQSHFLTIRVDLNHNSMVTLEDDPISFSGGRNWVVPPCKSHEICLVSRILNLYVSPQSPLSPSLPQSPLSPTASPGPPQPLTASYSLPQSPVFSHSLPQSPVSSVSSSLP